MIITILEWVVGIVLAVLALWLAAKAINFVIDSAERWEE